MENFSVLSSALFAELEQCLVFSTGGVFTPLLDTAIVAFTTNAAVLGTGVLFLEPGCCCPHPEQDEFSAVHPPSCCWPHIQNLACIHLTGEAEVTSGNMDCSCKGSWELSIWFVFSSQKTNEVRAL